MPKTRARRRTRRTFGTTPTRSWTERRPSARPSCASTTPHRHRHELERAQQHTSRIFSFGAVQQITSLLQKRVLLDDAVRAARVQEGVVDQHGGHAARSRLTRIHVAIHTNVISSRTAVGAHRLPYHCSIQCGPVAAPLMDVGPRPELVERVQAPCLQPVRTLVRCVRNTADGGEGWGFGGGGGGGGGHTYAERSACPLAGLESHGGNVSGP